MVSASTLGKATTAVRGAGRAMQQSSDVGRAKETVETYEKQLEDLNAQFKEETDALAGKIDPTLETLDTVVLRPKKTDIAVQLVALVWAPYRTNDRGQLEQAW